MSTTVVRCPAQLDTLAPGKSIFLGGGITGCPDWQKMFIESFSSTSDYNTILIDPRRSNFDSSDESMSVEQIEWEFRHLLLADLNVFWFSKATLCPITLFELAYTSQRGDDIIVGIEPGYLRAFDIREQLKHLRPDIGIVNDVLVMGHESRKFLERKYGAH